MRYNKTYQRLDGNNNVITFPFREKVGIYKGVVKSGFLKFKLSGKMECIINGGKYREVNNAKS